MKGRLLTVMEAKTLAPTPKKFYIESSNSYVKSGLYNVENRGGGCNHFTNDIKYLSCECVGIQDGSFKVYEWVEESKVKEYLTWQIWQDAEKLEGRRFKALQIADEEMAIGDIAVVVKYGDFYGLGAEKFSKIRIQRLTGFERWALVKEPVSFIEAVNALKEHKNIYCMHLGRRYDYKKSYLTDEFSDAISIEEILEGVWTIDED